MTEHHDIRPDPPAALACTVVELEDTREPVDIFAEVAALPYSCFLDSSLATPPFGLYSFIAFDPYLVLRSRGRITTMDRRGDKQAVESDPFEALRAALAERTLDRASLPAGLPPFVAGGIGFLGYELGRYVEKLPCGAVDDLGLPELAFCFYDRVLAFDHTSGRRWLMATALQGDDPRAVADEALSRIAPGAGEGETGGPPLSPPGSLLDFDSGFTRQQYIDAVGRVKDYIVAGDIYQANLSQRYSAPLVEPAWSLYRRLRERNAAPFAAYLNFGEFAVASSSPERFLQVEGNSVETRPIKGTRPRREDPAEDAAMRAELLASAKDRAELSMIVDLERNDLGRVCEYGSVVVDEHAVLESYATVHHLVSTVRGVMHQGRDMVDLLRATFPGGSITGAPKIRSMEIIDELEPTARSVYTGGIGYLGFGGRHDINVAIRTIILAGGRAYFQVGGGIVADSDPADEYQETLDKGKAMFESITMAGGPEQTG